jgi:hypothetical protein
MQLARDGSQQRYLTSHERSPFCVVLVKHLLG